MENIGDQLKKAFEAYRQASIEKDSAKRELQQKTEYYQSYTQQLEQHIEDQNKLITELKALLSSAATKLASDEVSQKYPALQKQEVESLSSCDHHTDDLLCSHQMFLMRENMDTAEMPPCRLPRTSSVGNKDVLDVFWELQGHFQLIQALTRKQTNQLRKMSRRDNIANELQFSIPIQCTDVSAERSEGPLGSFSTAVRSREEEEKEEDEEGGELAPVSRLPGGANPEDGRFFADSLMELSVRFPPSADGEREFLNSAVGNPAGAVTGVSMVTEEMSLGKAVPLPMPHAGSASTNLPHEGIRGPQQLRWSPDLCESTAQGACEAPPRDPNHRKCEFCNALVPFAEIYSHLNSHFQSPTSNGH